MRRTIGVCSSIVEEASVDSRGYRAARGKEIKAMTQKITL